MQKRADESKGRRKAESAPTPSASSSDDDVSDEDEVARQRFLRARGMLGEVTLQRLPCGLNGPQDTLCTLFS